MTEKEIEQEAERLHKQAEPLIQRLREQHGMTPEQRADPLFMVTEYLQRTWQSYFYIKRKQESNHD